MSAKVFVERYGKRYEVVPCGRWCGFARKDERTNTGTEWESQHCNVRCYLPKWWLNSEWSRNGNICGLREIPKPEVKIDVIPTTPDERSCIEAAIVSAMNRHTKKAKEKASKESK